MTNTSKSRGGKKSFFTPGVLRKREGINIIYNKKKHESMTLKVHLRRYRLYTTISFFCMCNGVTLYVRVC